ALATASDGERHVLIHRDDVSAFLQTHHDLHAVCHHATFDFWVLEQHLRRRGEQEAQKVWWKVAEDGRLHDTMLLDMLVRLARDDSFPEMRNLGVVAREYVGLEVDKADPYRLRYGEIIGKDWATVEAGFFTYAIKDAIVTLPAYRALRQQAMALAG